MLPALNSGATSDFFALTIHYGSLPVFQEQDIYTDWDGSSFWRPCFTIDSARENVVHQDRLRCLAEFQV